MSGVQVAEEGNRRKGKMNAAEIEQCVGDILDWFERKANLKANPVDRAEIQSLEKALDMELPESLQTLLEKQNGDLWFNEFRSLSANDIIDKYGAASSRPEWKDCYVPFAADIDDTFLVLDTSNSEVVYEFGEEGRGREVADSVADFLEDYRDRLLSGKYEFIEDVGIVERARK